MYNGALLWLYLSGSMQWVVRRVVTWPISKNSKKMNVVVLHCSFQNLFELCSKVFLLWRYEVKDFQKHCVFFCFLHFSWWKQQPITWFHHIWKAKRRGYNSCTMGILPKKEGGYPKRDIDSSRLQKYYWSTTKVRYRLQSLLTDYKRLQKVGHRLQSLLIDYKSWT